MTELISNILIIGYGSQAKAWYANLKDSGRCVDICIRNGGNSQNELDSLHIKYKNFKEDLSDYDTIIVLTPDHTHKQVLQKIKTTRIKTRIIFAHGLSNSTNHFNADFPNFEFILLAPKSIAKEVRNRYLNKKPLGAAYSCNEENEKEILKLAIDLGINKGPFKSSFDEETKADLFSEQSLLCSLIPFGILETYNTLVENGIDSNIAYLESFEEAKLIMDTLYEIGPENFFNMISPAALIGANKSRKLIFSDELLGTIEKLKNEIWSGKFQAMLNDESINDNRLDILNAWKSSSIIETHSKMRN